MQSVNICNLLGYVGSDVNLITRGENNFAVVNLCTKPSTENGKVSDQWHNAIFKGDAALAVAGVKKGSYLHVTGAIVCHKWQDKNKIERSTPQLNVEDFSIIGKASRFINQCNFIGNLGAAPKIHNFQNNKVKAEVQIAVNYGYGENQSVQWFTLIFWDNAVKTISKLKKGDSIFAAGSIHYKTFTDSNKVPRMVAEVSVKRFSVLSTGKNSANGPDLHLNDFNPYESEIPLNEPDHLKQEMTSDNGQGYSIGNL